MSYGVYVIQLRDTAGPRDHPHLPNLYVGQSVYDAEVRLSQHRQGYWTGSKKAGPHAWRLRRELFDDLPRVARQERARVMEAERAQRLARAGFTVRCDGVVARVAASKLEPFSRAELTRVRELLSVQLKELQAAALRHLSVEEVVRVLRWAPGVTISDLVATPCELAGLYAHASQAAVAALVGELRRG